MDNFSVLQLFVHSFFRRDIFLSTLIFVHEFFVYPFFVCPAINHFFLHALFDLRSFLSMCIFSSRGFWFDQFFVCIFSSCHFFVSALFRSAFFRLAVFFVPSFLRNTIFVIQFSVHAVFTFSYTHFSVSVFFAQTFFRPAFSIHPTFLLFTFSYKRSNHGRCHRRAVGAACHHWYDVVGQKLCYFPPPLKFCEHAVDDINRKYCPLWRKAVAPPLVLIHRRRNGRGHGARGPWPPHFLAKIILKIFYSFLQYNFDVGNDPPGQEEHKSALKYIVDWLVFAEDEIEVSLAPSLFITFLRPCSNRTTIPRRSSTLLAPQMSIFRRLISETYRAPPTFPFSAHSDPCSYCADTWHCPARRADPTRSAPFKPRAGAELCVLRENAFEVVGIMGLHLWSSGHNEPRPLKK